MVTADWLLQRCENHHKTVTTQDDRYCSTLYFLMARCSYNSSLLELQPGDWSFGRKVSAGIHISTFCKQTYKHFFQLG